MEESTREGRLACAPAPMAMPTMAPVPSLPVRASLLFVAVADAEVCVLRVVLADADLLAKLVFEWLAGAAVLVTALGAAAATMAEMQSARMVRCGRRMV